MLLDAEVYDYAHTAWGNEGFVVSVDHHSDIGLLLFTGIMAKPGTAVEVGVVPTLFKTTSEARTRFSPEKRHCYFEDEIDLEHLNGSYRYVSKRVFL